MNKKICGLIIMMMVFVGMMTNCYSVASYSGDGRLIDNGSNAATDRFILDLGTINLDKQNTQIYLMNNLPLESFVIGIKINVPSENSIVIEKQSINATISIELLGSKDESVIKVQSPLNTWTWSVSSNDVNTAFIYKYQKPDTYFTPIKNGQYKLKVVVVQPDLNKVKYEARLLLKSGGWK